MNARPPRAAAPAVQFDIDRVDLVGMPMSAAQSRQFEAAFTLHLQHLTREFPWAAAAATRVPHAIAPAVNMSNASTPAAIGRDVANALFQALRSTR